MACLWGDVSMRYLRQHDSGIRECRILQGIDQRIATCEAESAAIQEQIRENNRRIDELLDALNATNRIRRGLLVVPAKEKQ